MFSLSQTRISSYWSLAATVMAAMSTAGCALEVGTGPALDGDELGDNTGGGIVCQERVPIEFEQRFREPEMLLLVDKSGSMSDQLSGFEDKWSLMKNSLSDLVAAHPNVRFGLSLYPSGNRTRDCSSGHINVAPEIASGAEIVRALDSESPGGYTPTGDTLAAALEYYSSAPEHADGQFVLLATDGNETCGGQPNAAAAELLELGVKTYVLGFGGVTGIEGLRGIARAGGTDGYYSAASPDELKNAFSEILGLVSEASCTLALGNAPVNVDDIVIEVGGVPITSGESGWSYDAGSNTIQLDDDACQGLREDTTASLVVDLGCGPFEVE